MNDTTREVLDEFNKNWKAIPAIDRQEFKAALVSLPFSVGSLYKTYRAAKRGDYGSAIMWAILWHGLSNNFSNNVIHNRLKNKRFDSLINR